MLYNKNVTLKEIFHQYFKRKLIVCIAIGIAATLVRVLGGHQITFAFVAIMLSFFILAALVIGYIDYNFYEKSAPKVIAGLIDKEPLYSFQKIGFMKEENNKLEGHVNNYKIILSPLTNLQGDKVLSVLIPLQIREGLDSYFTKYNDHFRFTMSGDFVLAEAIIRDYEKQYGFNDLFNLMDKTTMSLKEDNIEPLKGAIVDHEPSDTFLFLEPWVQLLSGHEVFEEQLKKEVSKKHSLYGKNVKVIGRRKDNDDILIELEDERFRFAIVHLTWAKQVEANRSFPQTQYFTSWVEVYNNRIVADHDAYK